jgi:phage gpG-like protein
MPVKQEGFDELEQRLEQLGKFSNASPTLREVMLFLAGEIQENFFAGGRPDPWPPSKRAEKEHGQTLLDTGRLMKSVSAPDLVVSDTLYQIVFGSNLPYAAIHQFGFEGDETVRSFTRRVRSRDTFKKVERVSKRTGEIYKKRVVDKPGETTVREFTRHMIMPQRSYIIFSDPAFTTVGQIVARSLAL